MYVDRGARPCRPIPRTCTRICIRIHPTTRWSRGGARAVANNCVGLDIGSSSIKMLQVKPTSKGVRLCDFGIEPLPPQTIVDGTIMDQGAVVEAIRRLRSTLGIKNRMVATAICAHSVTIKKIH